MRGHAIVLALFCTLILSTASAAEEPTPTPAPPPTTEVAPPTVETKVEPPPEKSKGGIYIGGAPIYHPKIMSDLGTRTNFRGEVGLRLSPYSLIGLRVSNSNLSSLSLGDGTLVLKPNHWLVGISVHGEYPLTAPDFLFGRVQFLIPGGIVTYMNIITARGTPFTNLGIDGYGGAGTRIYFGSDFFIDIAAVYHLGVPVMKLESTPGTPLKNSSGEEVGGSTTGFELRMGFSFLL